MTDSWSISQAQSNNTRAQEMVSLSALQNRRCLQTNNTDISKTLLQRPKYSVIHPS